MKQILIFVICLTALSCEKNGNIISPNGEMCEGHNGTISTSGKWQEFNTSNSCLPANTIRCLEIDHNNNLWIGTDNGLVFYNGVHWIVYNTGNSGILTNGILSLACEDDTVWIGMGGGLAKFNRCSWTIYDSTNSPLNPRSSSSLPIGITVTTLKVDSKHNVWVGTNYSGLYKFDKTNWTIFYPSYETQISSPAIESIDADAQDVLWIGHLEPSGVDKFNGSDWTNYTPDNSLLPDWYVNDIYVDKINVKWFATSFGLAKFDNTTWTVFNTNNSNIQDEIIFSITSDSKNNLWIGTFSGGLLTINDNNWVAYYFNDSSAPPKPYNTINSVKVDRYDNKWLGTYNGLYKFNENGIIN